MKKPPQNLRRIEDLLSASEVYRDYERAFTEGTGLPLRLQAPLLNHPVRYDRQQNPFCAMMAKSNKSCAQCYSLQCAVQEEARLGAKTLKCFAGLCETAVPVRVGENLIAFLHTGQVLLHRPDKRRFKKIAAMLLKWEAEVDLKTLEEHYFNTRVLVPKQYEALIRLLEIFARHLAECGNAIALHASSGESPTIERARGYIRDHSDDELSLVAVAKIVNMSAGYFSTKFKEMTGISFVDYVARTRIEKARDLLLDPNRRVSEIAFEVGFQSLSQFNRTFRRIAGESPREYRAKHAVSNA